MAVFSLLFPLPAVLLDLIVEVLLLLNNWCKVTLKIKTSQIGKVCYLFPHTHTKTILMNVVPKFKNCEFPHRISQLGKRTAGYTALT